MHADSIRRDQPEPPYRQLAAILRDRIERGELTGTVPSIRQLSQDYEVALNTARRALALLVDDGLIVTTPGWGSFVKQADG